MTGYLNELDHADQNDLETSRYTSEEIKQKLAQLELRKETYEAYLWELKES